MRALLVALFGLWRLTLGSVLPNSCRFRPTCSHYAQEALVQRGLIVGLGLTAWRLLRCNPFTRGGYDPLVRSSPPCTAASSPTAAERPESAAGAGASSSAGRA